MAKLFPFKQHADNTGYFTADSGGTVHEYRRVNIDEAKLRKIETLLPYNSKLRKRIQTGTYQTYSVFEPYMYC